MSAQDTKRTEIKAGGLRYRSKEAGSPFSGPGSFSIATMSCLLCGRHRPRVLLRPRKLLNRTQYVCADGCS